MARVSAKGAVRTARTEDSRARKLLQDGTTLGATTNDSFVNFAMKLGVGADSPLTGATYGFNPLTRNRVLLEWMYRGSWLCGAAVDAPADDMTRAGIEYLSEMSPDDQERIDVAANLLDTWPRFNEVIKWGRLYGGAVAVALVDGQDLRTPLRLDTVAPGQYKGMLVLDRWMLEPTTEDLVTDMGPHLGCPKYYRVQANSPALRGQAVHYSRVLVRHDGTKLPYQQKLTENMWGLSVLERLYDRMIAFDSASTGAAQLVYKAFLRTLKVENLRQIVSNAQAMQGFTAYVDTMRRYQGIEGITVVDKNDDFEVQSHQAFSGLDSILRQFAEQLAGALQIPLVRLFGQSPGGLGSNGDSEQRQYYDRIRQAQQSELHHGVSTHYKLISASEGIKLPDNFRIGFRPLWELTDTDKANIAKTVTDTVTAAKESGLISDQVAMKELRQASRSTGIFTNITQELIEQADDQLVPPVDPEAMAGLMGGGGGEQGDEDAPTGQDGQEAEVGSVPTRRKRLQQPAPPSEPTGTADRAGAVPRRKVRARHGS